MLATQVHNMLLGLLLFFAAVACVLDAGTTAYARANRTGGNYDHRQ